MSYRKTRIFFGLLLAGAVLSAIACFTVSMVYGLRKNSIKIATLESLKNDLPHHYGYMVTAAWGKKIQVILCGESRLVENDIKCGQGSIPRMVAKESSFKSGPEEYFWDKALGALGLAIADGGWKVTEIIPSPEEEQNIRRGLMEGGWQAMWWLQVGLLFSCAAVVLRLVSLHRDFKRDAEEEVFGSVSAGGFAGDMPSFWRFMTEDLSILWDETTQRLVLRKPGPVARKRKVHPKPMVVIRDGPVTKGAIDKRFEEAAQEFEVYLEQRETGSIRLSPEALEAWQQALSAVEKTKNYREALRKVGKAARLQRLYLE